MDWTTFPWDKAFIMLTVVVSGLGIVIGIMVPAIGQMVVASKALGAIARQPEASDAVNRLVLIALALIESLAIYVLAVILILLFANPMREFILNVAK